jgi:hypothetical protein
LRGKHERFFIRDDVPANKDSLLGKYFEDGNFKTPLRPGSSNYKTMKTDLTDTPNNPCQNTGDDGARYPSQDQVSDLFMGFSLVMKSLEKIVNAHGDQDCLAVNDFSSTYYTEANGNRYYFADYARYYSSLIMDYLTVNNYKIKVPNLANSNSKDCYAKYGGTEAQLNAFGIAKAGANMDHLAIKKHFILDFIMQMVNTNRPLLLSHVIIGKIFWLIQTRQYGNTIIQTVNTLSAQA